MQQTAIRKAPATSSALASLFTGGLLRAPQALFHALVNQQRQAEERIQLRRLTDYQLRDMGLTREAAEEMARRTIWSRPA